jgi:acyl-CoA thioester hydrolase
LQIRVYYQHTDAGGVVYHARYLDFMEAARTELLHTLGFDLTELATSGGAMFIVHRVALEFRQPARLNDLLTITVEPTRVGRARVIFTQRVLRGEDCLVSASIELACVHPQTFRPVPVPPALHSKLVITE